MKNVDSGEKKKRRMREKFFSLTKRQKIVLLLCLAFIAIIIFLFGTKIALYLNFILGNDIIIKLSSSDEFLPLESGQWRQVSFEASVSTNPFCKTRCSSDFEDISKGATIDSSSFTLTPSAGFGKEYNITKEDFGTGQRLYRFSMECSGVQTFFCHTSEKPTQRNILVTVNYELSSQEKELKAELGAAMQNFSSQLSELWSGKENIEKSYQLLSIEIDDKNESFSSQVKKINNSLLNIEKSLLEAKESWNIQDYNSLKTKAEIIKTDIIQEEIYIDEAQKNISLIFDEYNNQVFIVETSRAEIENIKQQFLPDEKIQEQIKNTITILNNGFFEFAKKSSLNKKIEIASGLNASVSQLKDSIANFEAKKTISLELNQAITYDMICEAGGQCSEHTTLLEISSQNDFDLKTACDDAEKLSNFVLLQNKSVSSEYISQNYPENETFKQDISILAENIEQNIILSYILQLNQSSPNYQIISGLLKTKQQTQTNDYSTYNLTPAIIAEIAKRKIENCDATNISELNISALNFAKIIPPKPIQLNATITFDEPKPLCCAFGKCQDCCTDNSCREETEKYPVIFLHGHAFNKGVSTEYSLDAFNKIQEKLESDGYINAGAISLYTRKNVPYGVWNSIPEPLSIKASYYYDLFGEQENYVLVQTKSENIDTYAIRLKEIIDNIEYRQQSPKVIIIAHSMGGLVARRYIQIFGQSKVEKLILIGTPNTGIEGSAAELCRLLGEELECRDLTKDSLFLSKLNREQVPSIDIINIIGVGCGMNGEDGDGVVLNRSAYMKGKTNYYINGSCTTLSPLHIEILDIDRYPQVYSIILSSLKNSS